MLRHNIKQKHKTTLQQDQGESPSQLTKSQRDHPSTSSRVKGKGDAHILAIGSGAKVAEEWLRLYAQHTSLPPKQQVLDICKQKRNAV